MGRFRVSGSEVAGSGFRRFRKAEVVSGLGPGLRGLQRWDEGRWGNPKIRVLI